MRVLDRAGQGLRRFRRDRRGVSAVEFALVAPVLILIYFGMAELSQAMMAQRRVSHSASAIGDLVTQSNAVTVNGVTSGTTSKLSDLFSAASTILSPFDTAPLKLRVSSITGVASGSNVTPTVDWCDAQNATCKCPTPADPKAPPCVDLGASQKVTILPAGLITAAGDNVIMAEATYHYTLPVAIGAKTGLDYSERFYLRARNVSKVTCADCTSQ